ncbi:MAG: hypothetical protein H6719_38040 [Sandaracinaceae bacterium]|nr:hypothetical protein [Sandaracinaceae bacterium]
MTDLSAPDAQWHRVYTRRICRYLLEHLDDEHMMVWEVPFTALHEMVGFAYSWRSEDAEGLGDVEAWALVRAPAQFAMALRITRMPDWVDLTRLLPHMRGFIRYLVGEGAISEADADRLDHEYAELDPAEAPHEVV